MDLLRSWLYGELEFGASQLQRLAGSNVGFLDRLVIDKSSIGRAQISDYDRVWGDDNLAMEAGNGGIGNTEVVGRISTERVEAVLQLSDPRLA